MSELRLSIEHHATASERREIAKGLIVFNATFAGITDAPPLTLFLRDGEGQIRGGLLGEIYWGWVHIVALWIDEEHRGKGYGTELVLTAEKEAQARGCHSAHLDTY